MQNPLTTPIRLPWLTLRGPLRPRPWSGLFAGATMGWLLALRDRSVPNVDWHELLYRSIVGCAIAGLLIGSLLRLFRSRLAAGVVAALAVAIAFYVTAPVLDRSWNAASSLLMGIFAGIIYGALFWSYVPPAQTNEARGEE